MRSWRAVAILTVCGFLASCSTETLEQSYQKPLVEPMTEGLRSFFGKPAQVAFSALHYPDDQKIIADKKVYIWSTQQRDCVIRSLTRVKLLRMKIGREACSAALPILTECGMPEVTKRLIPFYQVALNP